MEPSAVFEPNAVRDERAKLLRSIKIMQPEEVPMNAVAGQYRGFREEKGVDPNAQTDTFAAVTFYIDNWRWAGVPFYIRSGKKLPKRTTDIAIQFNTAPHAMFTAHDGGCSAAAQSVDSANSAGGRDFAAVFVETAGQRDAPAAGFDGLQLWVELWRAIAFGIRDVAGGRDERRCDLYTRGRTWWRRAGGRCSRFWKTGTVANSIFRITSRGRGGRRKRTRCWRGNGHTVEERRDRRLR